jgi:Cu-Zn family superoxide dismutase
VARAPEVLWKEWVMNRIAAGGWVLVVSAITVGAVGQGRSQEAVTPQRAVAVLHPTMGSSVTGTITFVTREGYTEISGEIRGLTPGLHGFHVHEYGDISSTDGSSAGAHFNPTNMPHGDHVAEKRHVGDLGNIRADAGGRATLQMRDRLITLHGPHSIVGRALVVHAKADDLKSQPSGDAGGRVAYGVVGVANPKPAP